MDAKKLRKKGGFIVSAELIFIVTILVIGLIVGWVKLRNAIVYELSDVADAVGSLEQTYGLAGLSISAGGVVIAVSAGSAYQDRYDQAATGAGSAGTDLEIDFLLPEVAPAPGSGNENEVNIISGLIAPP